MYNVSIFFVHYRMSCVVPRSVKLCLLIDIYICMVKKRLNLCNARKKSLFKKTWLKLLTCLSCKLGRLSVHEHTLHRRYTRYLTAKCFVRVVLRRALKSQNAKTLGPHRQKPSAHPGQGIHFGTAVRKQSRSVVK